MLKYICGGIGLTSLGLGIQPYIKALQPYSLWFIFVGIFLFITPLLLKLFNVLSKRSFIGMFTKQKDIYLRGSDIGDKYGIKPLELKQHIAAGLPAYIRTATDFDVNNIRPASDRDLIALEVWTEEASNWMEQWLFKTDDIKQYIKNT
jgi:hypothetical protein